MGIGAGDGYAYLDAASSEPLHPAARDVLLAAVDQGYADPRRLHGPGRNARLLIDNAREVVAESLAVARDEVVFTSSGTEAVQLGLLGLVRTETAPAVVSAVEHQAVTDAAGWHGRVVRTVPVDRLGRVDPETVAEAAATGAPEATGVVAVQHANHEVGTVQPVEQVAERLGGVPLFVDACASMGRLPLPDGWSALAGSAHKWGGPTGVGVLVVRRRAWWARPYPTDDPVARTEHGFTDVPGALAAAAALRAVVAERDEVGRRQRELIDLVRARVAAIPDVDVVGDPDDRLPHLVTFSFLYVDGEALVTELDRLGFGLASGSACASDTREPSRVLTAMGALTHGNARLSLTRDTTRAQVEALLDALPAVVARIRAQVGIA
ncbi:cysteine desulfurase family protein [Nocardioides cheoyonin]|uniref:cysteine desulfurase family protein n=1 Tax=Nocardioides cheoyonin TaxID=3156615 RepID=UPI0032B4BDE6